MDLIPNKNKNSIGGTPTTRQSILGLGSARGEILASKSLEKIGALVTKIAIAFLIICVVGGGVFYFFNWQAEKEISKIKEQAGIVSSQLRQGDGASFRDFVREIEGFKQSLQKRIYVSNLFSKIEESTVVGVLWNSLQMDVLLGSAKVSGRAGSYSIIAKQAVALKSSGMTSVNFDNIKLSKTGGVSFDTMFYFNPNLKQKKQIDEQ